MGCRRGVERKTKGGCTMLKQPVDSTAVENWRFA